MLETPIERLRKTSALNLLGPDPGARAVVAATLVLLPLIYFFPAVKGDLLLCMGDGWSYSLPMRVLLGKTIAQGVWPLWNPYTFAGMPLLAAIQPGALYPPNWLFAVFSPGVAMNVVVILIYHTALIGAYLYARAIGIGRLGSLVAGMSFAFGGFMIGHLEQTNFIAAAAWLPWIVLSVEKLYRSANWREAWRWVAAGSVIIALQLFAGLPQATWQIVLVSVAYLFFSFFLRKETERTWRWRLRFAVSALAMAVCGGLLSAIQLLPARELQQQGERAAISYQAFAAYPMPPRFWLSLIFPYFFGGGLPPLYHVGGWDDWWLHKWAYTHVGMIALLLGLVAMFAPRRQRLVWFWAGTAVAAVVMALGEHLPFGINHLLYRVPIYNLFRGSYRHTLEFTFALAVLAGIGMNHLARADWKRVRRALTAATLTLALMVAFTAVIYRFFASRLGAPAIPPASATRLTNPEAFVPLLMFILSAGLVWYFARRKGALASLLLLVLLLVDLASYGWFSYWRTTGFQAMQRLGDPPAVSAIKGREADLNTFRIASYAPWPYNHNFELINHANLTVVRGLQSVNGYDPMRLPRPAALAGKMDIFGVIHDSGVFDVKDQAYDLLNVRYLLRERPGPFDATREQVITLEGTPFKGVVVEQRIEPGARLELAAEGFPATELALVTTMTNSVRVADEEPMVRIRLRVKGGGVIERELLAGRDTAEWAYDSAQVRAAIRHRRAPVAESWSQGEFEGHRYLARFPFDRVELERVELESLRPAGDGAGVVLVRATLRDAPTGKAIPLESKALSPERWRLLGSYGEIELYENLKARPRAWFVRRVMARPTEEVWQAIKEGELRDGRPFDPAEVALLEGEDLLRRGVNLPPVSGGGRGAAQVTRYEPQRIEIQTRNPEPGFLVLSEIYYRGWEARVDGVKSAVYRADYALRGVAVPAGEHRVEFVFRAPSFRLGAWCSAAGVALLVAGAIAIRMRRVLRHRNHGEKP